MSKSKLVLPTITQLKEEQSVLKLVKTSTGKADISPITKSSDRGRGTSDRGRGTSDRGRGTSDRGRGTSDRGRGTSDRGRGTSDRGRGGRGGYIYSDKDLSELAIEGDYQRISLTNYIKGEERYSSALVYGQHPEVTEELLKNGANPTIDNNMTLIIACKMGALKTVQLLLNSGASLATYSTLIACLKNVVENGYDEILYLLLFQVECKLNEEDRIMLIALAKKYQNIDCLTILSPDIDEENRIADVMLLY